MPEQNKSVPIVILCCPNCEAIVLSAPKSVMTDLLARYVRCDTCSYLLMVGCDMNMDVFWYDLEIVDDVVATDSENVQDLYVPRKYLA